LGAVHRPRRLTEAFDHDPRTMKTALLDTNCLIDLDEDGEPASALRRILAEHRAGGHRLVVAAITASENPRRGSRPKTWPQFTDLLGRVGLAEVEILKPMAYWDVTFWGEGLWVGEKMADLESRVHAVLFPSLEMDDHSDKRRWRNAKCDVQVVWTAMWNEVDVLVTGDRRIVDRGPKLAAIRPIEVLTPATFARALEDRAHPATSTS
jgi:hypothetical protein